MAERVQIINTIKKELLPQTSEDEPIDVDEELGHLKLSIKNKSASVITDFLSFIVSPIC